MSVKLQLVSWKADRLLAKVPKALEALGPTLWVEAASQLEQRAYDWPYDTLRKKSLLMGGRPQGNGVVVDAGLRDIVDTGALLNSQTQPKVTSAKDGAQLSIEWTAPYSGVVLRGGDYNSAGATPYVNPNGEIVDNMSGRPGRNWIRRTFEAQPVRQLFIDAWNQLPA